MKAIEDKIKKWIGENPYNIYQTNDKKISYYDWWNCNPEENWFTRFIRKNMKKSVYEFHFYSVFGNGKFIKNVKKNKVFYSGENLELRFLKYKDHCINYVDLSMGFANLRKKNYLRFPLWIMYVFTPESDEIDIINRINEINAIRNYPEKTCALIASHDRWNTRRPIYKELKSIIKIDSAGKWKNNTKELWENFNNDKYKYLRNFKFNICPENTNTQGYVTEKLFESFLSGCIPIYYGSDNYPEPEVINQNSILFWNMESDNYSLKKEIRKMVDDNEYYRCFLNRPKFLSSSTEFVIYKFRELRDFLNRMVY